MRDIDKMIEVMQAYKDGAEIECRETYFAGDWRYIPNPSWSWDAFEYRIKEPEPTKGKVWIVVCNGENPATGATYRNGLVFRGSINNTPAVYGTKAEAECLAQSMKGINQYMEYSVWEVVL